VKLKIKSFLMSKIWKTETFCKYKTDSLSSKKVDY